MEELACRSRTRFAKVLEYFTQTGRAPRSDEALMRPDTWFDMYARVSPLLRAGDDEEIWFMTF